MIEIIPNWHPIFVHFTVALFSVSAVFYVLSVLIKKSPIGMEFSIVARWCLWVGTSLTIATLAAGFYAYYSVAHDTPSHEAMIIHRNWAIPTFIVMLVLTIWSFLNHKRKQAANVTFLITVLLGLGLLASTAWHGGELVYRYGLGVISLPMSNIDGNENVELEKPKAAQKTEPSHDNHDHEH